jgi:hypothetical protein
MEHDYTEQEIALTMKAFSCTREQAIENHCASVRSAMAETRAQFDATRYQRDRRLEYPPIGDQLDALFHAGVFPPEMAAQIQAVKNKYPKGSA